MDDTIVANFFVLANIVAFLTAANVLILLLLFYFLWHTNNKLSLPMNWKLVAFSVSLVGIFATENVLIRKALIPKDAVLYIQMSALQSFFVDSFTLLYVQYSWLRSHCVVVRVFPNSFKYLNWLVKIYPFVCYLHVFLQAISATLVTLFPHKELPITTLGFAADASIAVTGLLCITFDTILLIAFVKFLRATHKQLLDETDLRFAKIARFGMSANACAYAAFALFVAGTTMDSAFDEEVIWNVSYCCLVGVFIALAAMKVSLHRLDVMDAISTGEQHAKRQEHVPLETAVTGALCTYPTLE
ncbi:hypothetical protein HDU82_001829 [Entophlyctis luteolus]|nr:hypothetical protein HDU82_001829 [Entophlyctis luteolus]